MSTSLKTVPNWAFLSLAANGLLMLALLFLLVWDHWLPTSFRDSEVLQKPRQGLSTTLMGKSLDLGPRHQLTYQQWVALLRQEAEVTATQQPKHLTVLAGDSLSLWFPNELLPPGRHWLNQGISGETSAGLLKRLDLFDETQPEVIFVMIGINDLIRGVNDEIILSNQRQILHYLRRVHPQARIVVQSILPHGGTGATWEGRDRLLKISNNRIRRLNQELATIATEEGSTYLDLYPLFADDQGYLRSDLTTDGLHLNPQGYLVWRAALQIFNQLKLQPIAKEPLY